MGANEKAGLAEIKANIRPYGPDDLHAVVDVFTNSVRALAASYYSAEQLAAWAPETPDLGQWAGRLSQLQTIVAQVDGVLAGFASYNYEGYLDFLFTHQRFARRGIATKLYRHVEETLRVAAKPRVFTHSSITARPFFDAHGFRLEAEEMVSCRGVPLRRFAMFKVLTDRESA